MLIRVRHRGEPPKDSRCVVEKRNVTLLHCSKSGEIILGLGNEIISWGSAKTARSYDISTLEFRKFRIQKQLG
ncbi:hypothetical protein GCM10008018_62020 [Paenibacillus marchantiophytorum]|uniref:WYL domain-containing protein n=1 Tax=Paenibacillus marchantiophytorum TaxID=1619310 RepID=A0ABQ1FEA7_9BACL|nr:hypothetical protein GCM10008018_62020 [Paenibacillus marchantiophytorum]